MTNIDPFKEIMSSISKKTGNLVRLECELDPARQKEVAKSDFLMKRFFSYSPDCLFYIAEIDACWHKKFNLQPGMVYEYLYHSVPKGYKQIKWTKPKKQDRVIELIASALSCSNKRAKEILMFLDETDIKRLEETGKL